MVSSSELAPGEGSDTNSDVKATGQLSGDVDLRAEGSQDEDNGTKSRIADSTAVNEATGDENKAQAEDNPGDSKGSAVENKGEVLPQQSGEELNQNVEQESTEENANNSVENKHQDQEATIEAHQNDDHRSIEDNKPQGGTKEEANIDHTDEEADDYDPPEAPRDAQVEYSAENDVPPPPITYSENRDKASDEEDAHEDSAAYELVIDESGSEDDVDHVAILQEHPITVIMGSDTYPLVGDDGLYKNYPDNALTLEDVFGAVRDKTPDLPLDKELIFSIKPLGLRVGEDNLYTREVNTTDMIKLLATQPRETQLTFEVSFEERFISRLNYLYEILADELGSKSSASDPKRRKIES